MRIGLFLIDLLSIDTHQSVKYRASHPVNSGFLSANRQNTTTGDIMNNETLRKRIKQGDFKDIENWDVSNVTDMSHMFALCKSFNRDISKWDTSNVTDMSHMFCYAKSFNQDITNWDTSNVTNMRKMFFHAKSFNRDIINWDFSNVTDMRKMFFHAKSFNHDIEDWNVINLEHMSNMFSWGSNSFKCYKSWEAW
jgi:surface protein